MSEDITKPPADDSYEPYDVDVGAILRWGVVLVVLVVVSALASWVFFDVLASYENARDPELAPMAKLRGLEVPPEPRLQVAPNQDLQRMLGAEGATLSGYGWVDEKKGIVRVPVERAMELVLKDGLPTRPSAPGKGR